MNPIQFFLNKLAEEAGEITQAAIKAAIYGLDSHHPNDPDTPNHALIRKEFADLRAVLELLQQEMGDNASDILPTSEEVAAAKQKILKWSIPAIRSGNVVINEAQRDEATATTDSTEQEETAGSAEENVES